MSTTERVRAYLRQASLHGTRCAEVASHLCMAERTLFTRLKRESDTTYDELRTEERKRRCLDALAENPRTNFDRLSELCGYSDKQGAQRAFVRWFGMTLTQWRERS